MEGQRRWGERPVTVATTGGKRSGGILASGGGGVKRGVGRWAGWRLQPAGAKGSGKSLI